ncbi:hypothetical protein Cni_G26053 [Canna indica]|uniref:Uncharacterized protein n=1 Tax=Canna indica TaxID=4628 RepID=A0AAQ3QN07_9LILI|nr:hypothetical protein Cni_G26053 [Canna indica]
MTVAKNLLRFQCFSHRHPLPSSNRASGARMGWWLVALYQEIASSIHIQPEPNSPRPASEDLHEGSHNSNDGSWDESNSWASNMDRQKPADSLPSIEWNTKVATKEIESFP